MVAHLPSQVLVRGLTIIATFTNPLTVHSQETAVYRCHQDVTGHCEGILRCVSTPQVVFRRYQRVDQALRCAWGSNIPRFTLTITNQQYNDVKDKLDDLIPWLEKLLKSLAKVSPDDDREEVERRSELAKFVSRLGFLTHPKLIPHDRSLEDIGTRSLALSEKGKVARVLDKTQDSQEVIKLVEKLRQAILVYQVSAKRRQSQKPLTRGVGVTTAVDIQPGHPSDCEFPPLISDPGTKLVVGWFKSSFDELLKLHQVRECVRV